jgi:hypothetical protein
MVGGAMGGATEGCAAVGGGVEGGVGTQPRVLRLQGLRSAGLGCGTGVLAGMGSSAEVSATVAGSASGGAVVVCAALDGVDVGSVGTQQGLLRVRLWRFAGQGCGTGVHAGSGSSADVGDGLQQRRLT